jgi:hypothetical protein
LKKLDKKQHYGFPQLLKEKVQNMLVSLPKPKGNHPRIIGTTMQTTMEEISHQIPNPNTIPM